MTMLEVFYNDFIHMAQTSYPSQLLRLSIALLHGIYSVFPPPQVLRNNMQDPIYKKKLESGEGQWEVRKEMLGCMVDGATQCIELARDKKISIDSELHKILHMTKGFLFKLIE